MCFNIRAWCCASSGSSAILDSKASSRAASTSFERAYEASVSAFATRV